MKLFFIRKQLGIVGERIVRELNGTACLTLNPPKQKQAMGCAKSFGRAITDLKELEEALSCYVSSVCNKLRQQKSLVSRIEILLQTNLFLPAHKRYQASQSYNLVQPTQDTRRVIGAAKLCLRKIYRAEYAYQKVGIMLLDLVPKTQQRDLFSEPLFDVMNVVDNINHTLGSEAIFLGAQGTKQHWQRRHDLATPQYTTHWQELLSVK